MLCVFDHIAVVDLRYANAWRATGDHHDEWSSTASVIEQAADLQDYAGPGGWNYLDFIMTGLCLPFVLVNHGRSQADFVIRWSRLFW